MSRVVSEHADAAIRAAQARRDEIVMLLPSLTAELKKLDVFIDTWCDMAGCPRPAKPARRSYGYKNRLNPPREVVAKACRAILSEAGKPLSRSAMLSALAERGTVIVGKDPLMVLSTMLWRSQDIIKRTPLGYVPTIEAVSVNVVGREQ